jgi:hypothetical protein
VRRVALIAAVALAGCGSNPVPGSAPTSSAPPPTPAARAELAGRAAAAQDLAAVNFYTLVPGERTVMVVRATDGSWRVDIPGGALGGTVDVSMVSTGGGLYHCVPTGCVAADELTPEADPRVHHVFTDWLEILTDRSAALSVSTAPVPQGVVGDCFGVQPSAASLVPPVDAGVYCYQVDGTLTGAELGFGTLRLTGPAGPAPPTVALTAPVVPGDPPPTASPSPSPTPSPGPSPSATPSGSP